MRTLSIVLPAAEVERFFDRIVPSEEERAAADAVDAGDEESLRRLLASDPTRADAAVALARMLFARDEIADALAVLEPVVATDFVASALASRGELVGDPELEPAFAAWEDGDHASALDGLQSALAETGDLDRRDLIRRVMVGIFTELGSDHPLAREHRRRLSAALN